MHAGLEFPSSSGEVADDHGKSERWIIDCDQRGAFRAGGYAARNDDGGRLGGEKLRVIFLIAEKTNIARRGSVQRGHSGQRQIEPAPDDVTIDPLGEPGKREGECQLSRKKEVR